ncbi:expressed unknown protein [Seminavis robusta]|uniref:Uncharacterized protein n=1 Tax=Seminavis robusta TaxID=568900 RepID=A0A9N8EY23_9STRA|nr:expressed unknown protein [Seminavis robusta]|eukprot:Sro1946_g307050.1 n/a (326) ;mRNA; f:12005-12982
MKSTAVQWTLFIVLGYLSRLSSGWTLKVPDISAGADYSADQWLVSRRDWSGKVAQLCVAAASSTVLSTTRPAWADTEKEDGSTSSGLLSTNSVADMLHAVPTFSIVDASGVPFMVVGEDAKVTGYFFTTYEEAKRLLDLARNSADKAIRQAKREKQPLEDDTNPWTLARISTIPLDVAVTVVTKSQYTKNYFQVAPAFDDIEDALQITGKSDLPEGKVPLFYMENFTIPVTNNNQQQTPLYFRKSELIQEYQKQIKGNKAAEMPPILVTELFAVLLELVKPGGADEDLKNLVIVPPKGSLQKAKQCEKAGGNEPPFVFGKRNLVL